MVRCPNSRRHLLRITSEICICNAHSATLFPSLFSSSLSSQEHIKANSFPPLIQYLIWIAYSQLLASSAKSHQPYPTVNNQRRSITSSSFFYPDSFNIPNSNVSLQFTSNPLVRVDLLFAAAVYCRSHSYIPPPHRTNPISPSLRNPPTVPLAALQLPTRHPQILPL